MLALSFTGKFGQGVDEDVDTLGLVFVAAADPHDFGGIVVIVLVGHRGSHCQQALAGLLAELCERLGVGSVALGDAVGGHDVGGAAQQYPALVCGKIAHGGEDVGVGCRGSLHGVAVHHAIFACQGVTVHGGELLVERNTLAGHAAAHNGGVGGEDGADGQSAVLKVHHAGTSHPLVELSHDLAGRADIVAGEALHDFACGIAEQEGLDVFPVAVERIDAVFLPIVGEDLVLVGDEILEIDQDGYRFARDVPAADPNAQSLVGCEFSPGFEEFVVHYELGVLTGVHPNVRADVYMSVF